MAPSKTDGKGHRGVLPKQTVTRSHDPDPKRSQVQTALDATTGRRQPGPFKTPENPPEQGCREGNDTPRLERARRLEKSKRRPHWDPPPQIGPRGGRGGTSLNPPGCSGVRSLERPLVKISELSDLLEAPQAKKRQRFC